MVEKRKGERRNWRSKVRYPLSDSEGTLVISNRRRVVERRAGNHPQQPRQLIGQGRLRLYFHDKVKELSSHAVTTLVLGRAADCDIEVQAPHVSRRHAALEYVATGFVLIDDSTNGTFVRFDDGREVHLVKDQLLIDGSGIISVGKPITERELNLIYFWCI